MLGKNLLNTLSILSKCIQGAGALGVCRAGSGDGRVISIERNIEATGVAKTAQEGV